MTRGRRASLPGLVLAGILACNAGAMAQPAIGEEMVVAWAKDRNAAGERISVHVMRLGEPTADGSARTVEEAWLVTALPKPPFKVLRVLVEPEGERRRYHFVRFQATDPQGNVVMVSIERGWVRLGGDEAAPSSRTRPTQRPRAERMHGLEN